MGNTILPAAQARERMAQIIQDSKRRFVVQNQKTGILDFSAEARFALEAITNSKALLKCDPETLKDSMVHLAAIGLSLNPASQQVALIPRWNTKANRLDCTASPMYRGLMKLATDTGLVNNVTSEIVFEYEEDTFDVDLGSEPYLKHRPKFSHANTERVVDLIDPEKNRLIAAYCIAHLRNSKWPHITVMDLSEVLSIANASDAFHPRNTDKKPSGPWVWWAGEMVKKAVIRRASKQWPLSDDSRYQRLLLAVEADNVAEANEQRTEVRTIDLESDMGEVVTEEHVLRIKDLCSTQDLDPEAVYGNYGVNSLSKIKVKFFDEIEEKLLDRQRQYNNRARANGSADGVEEQLQNEIENGTQQELVA